MMKNIISILWAVLLTCLLPNTANAQSMWENPKNLKVLPADISPEDLSKTMRGFAYALGVGCTHCHMEQETEDGMQTVYALDGKETKRIARKMLEMVAGINKSVGEIDRGPDYKYVEVTCMTCHRVQERPVLIQTRLDDAMKAGGADEAIKVYSQLKEKHYGRHTYDFAGVSLSAYANDVWASGNQQDGLKLALFSQTIYPHVEFVHSSVGNMYMELERYDEAVETYKKGLAIRDRAWLRGQLELAKELAAAAKSE